MTFYICGGCPGWAWEENGPGGVYGPESHPLKLGSLGPHEWEPMTVTSADYEALFDLQQTRMERVRPLWQAVTGAENTWPDLGKLLDWLLSHIDVHSVALELHETKGGGPFGGEGDCECEQDVRRMIGSREGSRNQ